MLLAAYATGIVMVRFVAPWDMTGQCMIIGFFLLLWMVLYRSRWAWIPLLALLLVAGFLHASLQLKPPSTANHISRFAGTTPLILEGTIITIEKRATGGYRLLTEMRQALQKQGAAAVSGQILLYITEGELMMRPGQVVRWRSSLRQPFRFGNPGEFDYPLYLAARGIYTTAFIAHAEELVVVNHPGWQGRVLDKLRHTLATHIAQVVPEETAGFVQSLLLG